MLSAKGEPGQSSKNPLCPAMNGAYSNPGGYWIARPFAGDDSNKESSGGQKPHAASTSTISESLPRPP